MNSGQHDFPCSDICGKSVKMVLKKEFKFSQRPVSSPVKLLQTSALILARQDSKDSCEGAQDTGFRNSLVPFVANKSFLTAFGFKRPEMTALLTHRGYLGKCSKGILHKKCCCLNLIQEY